MISQQDVIKAIDAADVDFSWCWECFWKLRRGEIEPQYFADFQVRLTNAFVKLDRAYRAVKAEQGRLIEKKSHYKAIWFKARMGTLQSYLTAIKEALGIGRSLGDGFAWIFYRDESALLDEHAREQRQFLLPPNVGGLGERAFLEKMQGIGGMLVLYHAITSFLRLGDVSFFDGGAGRITTIGELKTRHVEGNTYTITLGCVAGTKNSPLIQQVEQALNQEKRDSASTLEGVVEQKLKRQMDQIAEAIKKQEKSAEDVKLNTHGDFHFKILEDVVQRSHRKSFEFRRAGAGLVLGTWRPRSFESLGQRIFRKNGNLEMALLPAQQAAQEVLDSNLSDNCLFVSSIGDHKDGFPTTMIGDVPLMWWPLGENVLRDVLFGHVFVVTLFNPAQLWAMLRQRGFVITTNARSQVTSIYRQLGEKRFEIGNFHHFEHLVQHTLMDENAVINMIEATAERANLVAGDTPIRINLRPRVVV
ncbi:hypothetical protein B5M44_23875 [Shinella sumterensis]|uniref:hypothetical protein n=1 Tax=Shinella sumterensis TaxID=1967501 RepID=UPI00106EF8B8|nr:hypothetical protein [Shinella sumterensis]MCD1267100.1 hypothetical protein [Shinella sumterensis]TFE94138.1 hypothetical protein B5M44_23875 [Shinella sumterensis]